jgi:mRNA-degrading endonuclease toxin of MazEF toxin-antitoxin module
MEAKRTLEKHNPYRQGEIYWLDNCEPLYGDAAKRRPVIVVSTEAMKAQMGGVLVVVACTSTVYPDNTDAIELPNRTQVPQTYSGLNKRTWAIPNWYLFVKTDRLKDRAGYISGKLLARVILRFTFHYDRDTRPGNV